MQVTKCRLYSFRLRPPHNGLYPSLSSTDKAYVALVVAGASSKVLALSIAQHLLLDFNVLPSKQSELKNRSVTKRPKAA